ncbi:MAG TPA: hypothetical protein VE378_04620 [Nitrososphaeraceae archaeon]|nr:hypothetical protein [Nitrososphaeraceae archaeon]
MRLSKYEGSMIIITISMISVISSLQTLQSADAQQQLIPQIQQQEIPLPQSPQLQSSNFTASIPLATSLLDVLKSQTNVSLADAMTDVTNSMGPNATVLSGSVGAERGFLVYRIAGLDDSDNINMVLVDPANGSILSQQQLPAAISQVLSTILQ